MKYDKRIYFSIFWVVLGAVLTVCRATGALDDYWSGIGTALMAVGVVQILRQIRYRVDDSYREKVDISAKDERNRFISARAWAWAGYLFVMIGAVGSVVLRIIGLEMYSAAAATGVCLIMVLYWLSYMCLKRKY